MSRPKFCYYSILCTVIVCISTNALSQAPVTPEVCLNAYLKTYQFNYNPQHLEKYFLLRNNRQLIDIKGYIALPDGSQKMEAGLKLFDQHGNLLKSVAFSQGFNSYGVDDQHILLFTYENFPAEAYSLTLVDENLDIVWTRKINVKEDLFSGATSIADVYMDEKKNLYILAIRHGLAPEKARTVVYKLDATGNEIWTSMHQIDASQVTTASISASPAGVIVVAESNLGYSFLYDNKTGGIISAYSFAFNGLQTRYNRHLKYDNGILFYASSTADSRLLAGTFDSLGKPIRMKWLDYPALPESVDSRDGFMVINTKTPKQALLKLDTALDIQFMNEYSPGQILEGRGLGIDPAGYIYAGGSVYQAGTGVYQPYLAKYGLAGELGSCTFQPVSPPLVDIPLTIGTVAYSRIAFSYPLLPPIMNVVPATTVLYPDADICIDIEPCNEIHISNPGPVCKLNTDQTILYTTSAECTKIPDWTFDAAYIKLVSNATGAAVFQFIKPGLTALIATIKTSCYSYADTLVIQIDGDPASLNLGADTTICPGDSLVLHAGDNYIQYIWQDGSSENSFIAKSSGRYRVFVANTCGDLYDDEINVVVRTIPQLLPASTFVTCANDSFMLAAEPGFTNYKWQSAGYVAATGREATAILSSPGAIMVNALSAEGCLAKDTMAINLIYARPVTIGTDTTICYSDSILLMAGTGYLQYSWSNGSGNADLKVSAPGKYHVTAKDINGCNARDTILLSKFKPPVLSLGQDRNICFDQPIQLDPGEFTSYSWQDGSIARSISIQTTGVYWVAVTDQNSCKASDTIEIKNMVAVPFQFLKANDTICRFRTLEIASLSNFTSYSWSTGATSSRITISNAGNYTLSVTDQDGCTASETIKIAEKDCLNGVFVPNAFSPNRDGLNDVFRAVVHGPIVQFSMTVFNRFGQIVFTTNDPAKSWDGTFKGKPPETGNYIWKCSYQLEGGNKTELKGYMLLVR
jgi:gliding motility-associated-like protein